MEDVTEEERTIEGALQSMITFFFPHRETTFSSTFKEERHWNRLASYFWQEIASREVPVTYPNVYSSRIFEITHSNSFSI